MTMKRDTNLKEFRKAEYFRMDASNCRCLKRTK